MCLDARSNYSIPLIIALATLAVTACSSSVEEVSKPIVEAPATTAFPPGRVYNKSIDVKLSCKVSKNKTCTIFYYTKVDDGIESPHQEYTGLIPLQDNKKTVVSFWGDDGNLREENVNQQEYVIDIVAPTVTSVTPVSNSIISPTESIVIAFSESMDTQTLLLRGSMVNQADGGTFTMLAVENDVLTISPINSWSSGERTLGIRGSDLAGNPLSSVELIYTVVNAAEDNKPPVTAYEPKKLEQKTAIDVSFSCADTGGSGCARIWYSTDGVTEPKLANSFDLIDNPNPTLKIANSLTLKFSSEDNNANFEATQSIDFIIENQSPVTTADIQESNGPFKDPISVTLTCNDLPTTGNTGCDKILYSLDGTEQSFSITTTPSVSIELSTTTTFSYYSVDKAGNSEQPPTTQTYVFGAKPATTITPTKREHNAPFNVSFSCISGINGTCAKIWYSIDSALTATSPFFNLLDMPNPTLLISKSSTLNYKSEDKNGNVELPRSIDYIIENLDPVTNISVLGSDGPFNATQTVTLSCSDTLVSPASGNSGCDKIVYKLGNSAEQTFTISPSQPSVDVTINVNTALTYYSIDRAGNTESASSQNYVIDLVAPTYTVSYPTASNIYEISQIVITFNENMNASVGVTTFSGNMQSQINTVIWSGSTNGTNDTLSIRPISSWTIGSGKTLGITASDIAGNAVTTTPLTYTVLKSGLNDTGVSTCSNADTNGLACNTAGSGTGVGAGGGTTLYPGQDAEHGRDFLAAGGSLSKKGGGRAGFDFTKLDSNGNDLANNASTWLCVRDNVTNLIWEVKTTDGGLRDRNHTYTWYNRDSTTNGGTIGTSNGGVCPNLGRCDTEKYVADINVSTLCGFATGWRMPNIKELISIVNFSIRQNGPAIDSGYFPNTEPNIFPYEYWSSSLTSRGMCGISRIVEFVWTVSFRDAYSRFCTDKAVPNNIRLVHGG